MVRLQDDHPQFLSLLRGINVGGKNLIAKDELKWSFEDLGFGSEIGYDRYASAEPVAWEGAG